MVLYDGNFDIKLVGKLDGLVEFSTLLFPSVTRLLIAVVRVNIKYDCEYRA